MGNAKKGARFPILPQKKVSKEEMIKSDIVDKVYEKLPFCRTAAAKIVEIIFDTIKDTLKHGENVRIIGFGTFVLRNKKERLGRNPKTGEPIKLAARRVLSFNSSRTLRKLVDSGKTD